MSFDTSTTGKVKGNLFCNCEGEFPSKEDAQSEEQLIMVRVTLYIFLTPKEAAQREEQLVIVRVAHC